MRRRAKIIFLLALFACFFAAWVLTRPHSSESPSPNSPVLKSSANLQANPTSYNTNPPAKPAGIATTITTSATNLAPSVSTPIAPGKLSPSALRQISAIESEKSRRNSAQNKMDSQLVYADLMRRGVPIAEGVPTQRVELDWDSQGRVLVDLKAEISPALLDAITASGGNVINSFPQYHAARASLPLAAVETLAARNDLTFIQPAVRAAINTTDSQGDSAHGAIQSRAAYSVNGTNVNVGVISDSVDFLSTSQIAGLVNVLPGQSGVPGTGEGTAMLEIVHDLAPGAQLYFATSGGSTSSFAANIMALRAAGCGIILDDLYYYNESPFQDGPVAQAVNTVTAGGALYFSAAGDSANKDLGFSGTWEGDFVDGGEALGFGVSGRIHSFGTQDFNTVSSGLGALRMDFFWSDPLGASTNDYDVFVLNSTGASVVASSTNPQTGTQDPYESLNSLTSGEQIVIVRHSGTNRFMHLETGRGRLGISTSGNTHGHSCATNAFDIAAVNVNDSGGGTNTFSSGTQYGVEIYSSDGPRHVFFQQDGTPITPGNFSSTGGAVRQKPDLTAADSVSTDLSYPFSQFNGTSAAVPHAAAIAALVESYNPFLTTTQIRTILTSTALDIAAVGVDRDSGYGIVMASTALAATPKPPPPGISILSPESAGWGRPVFIYGTNFAPAASVQFNGASAVYTIASNTLIVATVPVGASTGALTVSTPGGTASAGFVVLPAVAPANDNFANAQALTGANLIVATNTYGATKQTGEPNHAGNAGGKSVWYQWTATNSGPCSVDTGGSDFSTLLAVYAGTSLTNLFLIASNSTSGGGGISQLTFNANNGTAYNLAVDGFNGTSGNAVLRLVASNANPGPIILLGPSNQTVTAGADLFLSAVAVGSSPLAYQWSFGNAAINNATNDSLLMKAVAASQSGTYSILVTNTNGAATNFAMVTITNPPPQAQFGKTIFSPASGLMLNLNVAVGNNYELQSSTDLVHWTTLALFYANGSNTICLDPSATNFPARDYRLVSP